MRYRLIYHRRVGRRSIFFEGELVQALTVAERMAEDCHCQVSVVEHPRGGLVTPVDVVGDAEPEPKTKRKQ